MTRVQVRAAFRRLNSYGHPPKSSATLKSWFMDEFERRATHHYAISHQQTLIMRLLGIRPPKHFVPWLTATTEQAYQEFVRHGEFCFPGIPELAIRTQDLSYHDWVRLRRIPSRLPRRD